MQEHIKYSSPMFYLLHDKVKSYRSVLKRDRSIGEREDSSRVDLLMGHVVMTLDMGHIDGLLDPRNVDHTGEPGESVWRVLDCELVALEMSDVDRIEPDHGGEKANIGFGHDISADELLLPKSLFDTLLRLEHQISILLVLGLGGSKARLVHAIVQVIVDPSVSFVDGRQEACRTQVKSWVTSNLIELGIEHTDNFGTLVVDDGVEFLIPEDGDGETAVVVRIGTEVEVTDVLAVVEGVGNAAGCLFGGAKLPSLLLHQVIDD